MMEELVDVMLVDDSQVRVIMSRNEMEKHLISHQLFSVGSPITDFSKVAIIINTKDISMKSKGLGQKWRRDFYDDLCTRFKTREEAKAF